MDITDLILEDHHRQRKAFALLDDVDPADTDRLGAIWSDLADFLEVHAAAEEKVFYPALLAVGDPDREETQDAIADHNEIRTAIADAARADVGSDAWWKAVGEARSANTEHMGEEEDEGLPDFRKHATLADRADLGLAFEAAKAAPEQAELDLSEKDPDDYVEEHG